MRSMVVTGRREGEGVLRLRRGEEQKERRNEKFPGNLLQGTRRDVPD